MEKQLLEINQVDDIVLKFQNVKINLHPYINLNNQKTLINLYLESLSSEKSIADRFLEGEYVIILGILDILTDISIDNFSIDDIISSGLWNLVKVNILNYEDFRNNLNDIVKINKEELFLEKSIGTNFDLLVNKIVGFINKISDINIDKEGVSKILESLEFQKDEYNKIVDPSKVKETKSRKKKDLVQ